tara:strand:- start:1850 stop:2704 length:855 start_codon:yes stop_codon:yes gene_type:complete
MNYRNILFKGEYILRKNSINDASIDAENLLSISLNRTREDILLNLETNLNQNEIKSYINLINKRKKKEPISLITGKRYFWNSEFTINKHVLTPRFETELLVEEILKIFNKFTNFSILDIGTGSGCILISLLKERKLWRGTGIDISALALKNAKNNAKIQQIDNRIKFINSDIDKFYGSKYDLVVSNPPYISKIGFNNLDLGVKNFEPKKALYGGIDGLKIIEKVIKKSKIILKNNGLLALEIGKGQSNKVINLLKNNGFYVSKIVLDYQKIKRCIFARKINEKF